MSRPPAIPGGRRVDLHTHTHFSDGLLSPTQLVERATSRGLAAISVTDHDSIEAFPEARQAAGSALEVVPGIELSSTLDGAEHHILGYFIDPLDTALRRRLDGFREDRLERARAMVQRLNELGFGVDPAVVLELAGPGVVGRPHVAAALVRARHAESIDDAFRRFLGRSGVAFIPRPAFPSQEAIALIHAAGGLSVLAHPGGMLAESVVETLSGFGLRGLEIWHPQHGATAIRKWRAVADRLGLIETGGSDFHGPDRGMELGSIPVPSRALVLLKEAAGVAG